MSWTGARGQIQSSVFVVVQCMDFVVQTVSLEDTVSQQTDVVFKSASPIVSLAGGLAPSCEVYCFRKCSDLTERESLCCLSISVGQR